MSQTSIPPIRVRVVHPEAIVAFGLAAALRVHPDIVVCEASAAGEAEHPRDVDVVVCDPDTGIEIVRATPPDAGPERAARLLMLAADGRGPVVRQALAMGVHGCVLRGGPVEEFALAVRAVASGQRFLSVAVALQMAPCNPRELLTLRELEVLDLLWRGQCNKTIARELGIAVGTVKAHVKAILSKLAANGRTQAVSFAVERGLVGPQTHDAPGGESRPSRLDRRGYAQLPLAA